MATMVTRSMQRAQKIGFATSGHTEHVQVRRGAFARALRAAGMSLAALLLCVAPAAALAGPLLELQASARSEVVNDEMVVTLATERSGPDVGPLNDKVLAMLNKAIAEAKAVPRINARLGSITTQPNWVSGKQSGWQVRGDVVLDSADLAALAQLSGRLAKDLQLSGVQFRLSAKRRSAEEQALLQTAAANFRDKAAAAATAFRYDGYELKEMQLSQNGGMRPPMPMMRMDASAAAAQSLPVESGNTEITVTVAGKVELK